MRRKVLDDHVERFLSTYRFCTLSVMVAPKIPVGGVQDRQLSKCILFGVDLISTRSVPKGVVSVI